MPGFEGVEPVEKDDIKDGMVCVHCEHLLRDPLQTDDGVRVCKSCAKEIEKKPHKTCSNCNVTVENNCYPDKAAQRDILKIRVFCKYVSLGCEWRGALKEWEVHCAGCMFKGEACPHRGCGEMVALRQLEGHKLVCEYRQDKCSQCGAEMQHCELKAHDRVCEEGVVRCDHEGCGQEMKRKQLHQHKLHDCKIEECLLCDKQVERQTGMELSHMSDNKHKQASKQSKHVSDPNTVFRHLQVLAQNHQNLAAEVKGLSQRLTQASGESTEALSTHMVEQFEHLCHRVNAIEESMVQLRSELAPGTGRYQPVASTDKNVMSRIKQLEGAVADRDAKIQSQGLEIQELRRMVEKLQETCNRNSRQLKQRRGAEGEPSFTGKEGGAIAMEPRLLQLESRVEELTRQSSSTQVHVQELELQLQASLASTHNGSFLWRIPNLSRRKRDAMEERITSIYSPPFYTGRNGYKMCVRAYLNGDGSGYNTHISLFFVIMKGEFDNLLRWPFDHKVSMILVDQNHRKHIVQTFKPTAESTSFQKPVSEMNVASGCPQFAKLSIFDDSNYCKDDVMFIKCIVDTTRIFHP